MKLQVYMSHNLVIMVNGKQLDRVVELKAEDKLDAGVMKTYVMLRRQVSGDESVIESMRIAPFAFSLLNKESFGGYSASNCEMVSFEMELIASEQHNSFLTQKIVFKTPFLLNYIDDARPEKLKEAEKNDLSNLFNVLNHQQSIKVNLGTGNVSKELGVEDANELDPTAVYMTKDDLEQTREKARKLKAEKHITRSAVVHKTKRKK